MTPRPLLVCAALLLAATGCGGSDAEGKTAAKSPAVTTTASAAPTQPFTIDFAVSAAGDHVVLHGTTNLPDHTLVTVGLGRLVKFRGEAPRNFHVGGDGVQVSGGKFTADLEVDEKMMIGTLTLPPDQTSFGPVEKVSDTVSACVQVRPNDDSEQPQPDGVMKAIGQGGANFKTSPQKLAFGDALRLEALKTINLPSPALDYIGERLGSPVGHGNVGKDFCSL